MISQEAIAQALHGNKCPECGRHHMRASVDRNQYYANCGFCGVRWEITKVTFENHVQIQHIRS